MSILYYYDDTVLNLAMSIRYCYTKMKCLKRTKNKKDTKNCGVSDLYASFMKE
jgi:hypothetical protein